MPEYDEVWAAVDEQRASLADLLDSLAPAEWEAPSLCAGWRVRDVAAHLTLAHTRPGDAIKGLITARGDFDRMIHQSAIRQAQLPTDAYAPLIRAMIGSRRKVLGLTPLEPLIDVLVHGQDIVLPLGRARAMPVRACVLAADRVWPNLYPFRAARRLAGIRFAATDCSWTAGEGAAVRGPIGSILLLLTGRPAALPALSGPGVPLAAERLSPGWRTEPGAAVSNPRSHTS